MSNFVPADFVKWEVEYNDGTFAREAEGASYGAIDRARFKKFNLVNDQGVVIFDTWAPAGKSGNNFVYRRRTRIMENGQRLVIFVLGWLPDGPAFAINVADGTYRELPNGFHANDPDLYPPDPMPGEAWFAEARG